MVEIQEVHIPDNRYNRKRIFQVLAIARNVEQRHFSLKKSISVHEGYLYYRTSFARVDRHAYRVLLCDWVHGKLKDVPPMMYPTLVYLYYDYDNLYGGLTKTHGYLFPSGEFKKYFQNGPELNFSELHCC